LALENKRDENLGMLDSNLIRSFCIFKKAIPFSFTISESLFLEYVTTIYQVEARQAMG